MEVGMGNGSDKISDKHSENPNQSSGAVRKWRWPSRAPRPNEPDGFCGRKAILNRASALVTVCP